MNVGAFLIYMARLKGMNAPEPHVQAWLARVGLPEMADKRCEELSKGMQPEGETNNTNPRRLRRAE